MLNTVNVIEFNMIADLSISSVKSWPETPEGNKLAEEYFKSLAKENPHATDETIDRALEDGVFEIGEGAIVICHST